MWNERLSASWRFSVAFTCHGWDFDAISREFFEINALRTVSHQSSERERIANQSQKKLASSIQFNRGVWFGGWHIAMRRYVFLRHFWFVTHARRMTTRVPELSLGFSLIRRNVLKQTIAAVTRDRIDLLLLSTVAIRNWRKMKIDKNECHTFVCGLHVAHEDACYRIECAATHIERSDFEVTFCVLRLFVDNATWTAPHNYGTARTHVLTHALTRRATCNRLFYRCDWFLCLISIFYSLCDRHERYPQIFPYHVCLTAGSTLVLPHQNGPRKRDALNLFFFFHYLLLIIESIIWIIKESTFWKNDEWREKGERAGEKGRGREDTGRQMCADSENERSNLWRFSFIFFFSLCWRPT